MMCWGSPHNLIFVLSFSLLPLTLDGKWFSGEAKSVKTKLVFVYRNMSLVVCIYLFTCCNLD